MSSFGRGKLQAVGLVALFALSVAHGWAMTPDCGTSFLPDVGGESQLPVDVAVPSAPPANLGDKRTFFTLIPEGRARATLRHLGTHAAYWVDDRVAKAVDDAQIRRLADEFDRVIYPKVRSWVGSEWLPGIDGDYRVTVFFHDIEGNGGSGGFGGYVSQADARPTAENSNAREMLYIDAYALEEYDWFRFTSLVAHEFTHLVNWYQRGGRLDERWLEEGRAEFAEWAVYGIRPQGFIAGYLNKPSVSLSSKNSFHTWYGGSFLLLLYLHENFGRRAFSEAHGRSQHRGLRAIDDALEVARRSERIEDVLPWWSLALVLNDRSQHPRAGFVNLRAGDRVSVSQVTHHVGYPVSRRMRMKELAIAYVELDVIPAGALKMTVEGDVPGSLLVSSWRPRTRSFVKMPADADGLLSRTVDDLVAGESLLLVFNALAEQDVVYTARLEGAPAALPPRPADAPRSVDEQRFLTDRLLPADARRVGSLEHLGSLPFAAEVTDVAIAANRLWATTGWGLAHFDLSEPARPRFVQWTATDGTPRGLAVDDELVIVAQERAGVAIVDAADGALLGSIEAGGVTIDVARHGDWAFALTQSSGLRILDIVDPANPRIVGAVFTGPGVDMHAEGGRLFLSDTREGLRVFALDELPGLPVIGGLAVGVLGIDLDRGLLWGGSGGVVALDVANPVAIETIAAYPRVGPVVDVAAAGGLVVVAENDAGVSLLDVTNPRDPRTVGRMTTSGQARSVALSGRWAAVGDGRAGVSLVDVGEPSRPELVWHFDTRGTGRGVDVSEGRVYVSMGVGGVLVADALNIARVRSHGVIPTKGEARAVAAVGELAYVATSVGLEWADVRDPSAPIVLGAIPSDEPASDVLLGRDASMLYLAAGDLLWLSIQGDQVVPGGRITVDGFAAGVAASADTLYVAALDGGLSVVDVSAAGRPAVLRRIAIGVPTRSVAVDASRLVVGAGEDILLYDVREPAEPMELGRWDAGFDVRAVAADEGRVFAAGENSFGAWDARDPKSPEPLAEGHSLIWAGGIALGGNKLFIADVARLHIFRRTDDGVPLAVQDPLNVRDERRLRAQPYENRLARTYPNPFNPEAWIPFSLAATAVVEIAIMDASGRAVRRLELGAHHAGRYETPSKAAHWDGRNSSGEPVASGVYFVRLMATPLDGGPPFTATGRMVVAR